MAKRLTKQQRQLQLYKLIEAHPFVTDEELAKHFDVSVQTIRLDRLELGIPELRMRTMQVGRTETSTG